MHQEFLPAHNPHLRGKHHEIYLSDPRNVDAAKLKTRCGSRLPPLPEK
ncbi:MAG: hypothetical protein KF801_01710 [Cryobacterium sp.]|nr:hypothetical protein [Cryobacterium sp.]